ncbi:MULTISPECIES: class I SAM-dependent methyltransferase [Paenibacillus]|uniref:class I SAM-dependent methyltransferase n=1 Tax=Paenibacillus TaxID=44249 RepID=UPI0022B8C5FF|nr:class I SAM-dependent methyltransferase [Paenibacillus caseinilyticus]MCZ8522997.1 class I SAM-dependent methyltransferase [Paenibacillus caseinilyticus]
MNEKCINVNNLTKVEETMFITLYARALDYRSKNPILFDKTAQKIVDHLDYDFKKLKVTKEKYNTAIRTKELDDRIKRFIARNAGAVVLDLGCGLDSRVLRVHPPDEVSWYDVDFPEVIKLRKHFYTERSGYHMIGASLLDANWLSGIPSDRPVIIVADGVLPFIGGEDIKELFNRCTNYFHCGEIAFNGYTTLAVKLMKNTPSIKAIGIEANMGFDDPREPEIWSPRLKLAEEAFLIESSYASKMPLGFRILSKWMSLSPNLKREGGRILRYKFCWKCR